MRTQIVMGALALLLLVAPAEAKQTEGRYRVKIPGVVVGLVLAPIIWAAKATLGGAKAVANAVTEGVKDENLT